MSKLNELKYIWARGKLFHHKYMIILFNVASQNFIE